MTVTENTRAATAAGQRMHLRTEPDQLEVYFKYPTRVQGIVSDISFGGFSAIMPEAWKLTNIENLSGKVYGVFKTQEQDKVYPFSGSVVWSKDRLTAYGERVICGIRFDDAKLLPARFFQDV
jgi:hypothetical protein